ncbi:MAG: SdpI family protein [Clostridia bacterium]|nr:SdpI family protein [Clostridia bacterium]
MFVNPFVPLLVGVLFIAMGNYLPKCRQNYTMGIKTPWALNSEENWARTHRLGGYCFILGGFLLMLGTLLNLWWLLFPVLLLTAIIPLVYSYLLFRKGI